MLLLEWITTRLAARQKSGDDRIDAIEDDFKQHLKTMEFQLDFRFDRGEGLLILAQPIIVNGVEVVDRSPHKDEIIKCLERPLTEIVESQNPLGPPYEEQINPVPSYDNYPMWSKAKRLRNSLSHSRYEYDPAGFIEFTDFHNNKQTAQFRCSVFYTMQFAYVFALNCILWQESK